MQQRLRARVALHGVVVVVLLWMMGTWAEAAAEEVPAAVAAVQAHPAVAPRLSSRFLGVLPQVLTRAGFALIDPRIIDAKLAERPDLLAGCEQEACLWSQARLLGVSRLVVPRLSPIPQGRGGLMVEVVVYRLIQSTAQALSKVAEATETCEPCTVDTLDQATQRVAQKLTRMLRVSLYVSAVPAGARVLVDGKEVGRAPVSVVVEPGEHQVQVEGEMGHAERMVTVQSGQPQQLHLVADPSQLPEPPPAPLVVTPGPPRPRWVGPTKWTLLAAGVLALGVGAALTAVDGKETCKEAPALGCPQLLDTAPAGIALLVGGGLAVGSSAILFGLDYRAQRMDRVALLHIGGRF